METAFVAERRTDWQMNTVIDPLPAAALIFLLPVQRVFSDHDLLTEDSYLYTKQYTILDLDTPGGVSKRKGQLEMTRPPVRMWVVWLEGNGINKIKYQRMIFKEEIGFNMDFCHIIIIIVIISVPLSVTLLPSAPG